MSTIMDKVSGLVQDCKTLAQKYIWPDFAPERLPENTKAKVRQLPDTAQLDFYERYANQTENLRNTRNVSLFFFIFSAITGIFPISVAIVIYWWFLKENQLPEVANSALQRTLIKYKLPIGDEYKSEYQTKSTFQTTAPNARPDIFERRAKRQQETASKSSFEMSLFDIESLHTGYLVDYQLKKWKIVGEYEFNRKDGSSEKTFKLFHQDEQIFLHLWKKKDTLISYVTEQVNIYDVDENLAEQIISEDVPFELLTYQNRAYYLESEAEGLMYDLTMDSSGTQAMIWNYFDGQHRQILRLERFGRADFRVFVGKYVSPFEFSNIIQSTSRF